MGITVRAHHISFPITDVERSRAFYEGVLGLTPKPRPPHLDAMFPGMWYQAGACEVHLIQPPPNVEVGDPPPALNPMARHAAFAVANYAETVAHLERYGLEVFETNADMGQMWVRDPDGHIIELIVAP